MASTDSHSAQGRAVQRCDELIAWYESQKKVQRILDTVLQVAIIVAAGATALAASLELDARYRWVVVLPAVTTTIAAGLATAFGFRRKYVNFASAAEALKWAKLRYEIRAERRTEGDPQLEDFVRTMENIVAAEIGQWSETLLTGSAVGKKP